MCLQIGLIEACDRSFGTPQVELAERWRPYRKLAVSYLFASEFEDGP